jgi:hypothetical protein
MDAGEVRKETLLRRTAPFYTWHSTAVATLIKNVRYRESNGLNPDVAFGPFMTPDRT